MLVGSRLHIVGDHVAVVQARGVVRVGRESLEKDAVDAILLHPREMPFHGLLVSRTENMGRGAVGMLEGRRVFLVVVHVGQVRPHLNRAVPRG